MLSLKRVFTVIVVILTYLQTTSNTVLCDNHNIPCIYTSTNERVDVVMSYIPHLLVRIKKINEKLKNERFIWMLIKNTYVCKPFDYIFASDNQFQVDDGD